MNGLYCNLSKTVTAEAILQAMPRANTLIDIMAGGCAVTHRALKGRKFRAVTANDTNPLLTSLFSMAVNGELQHESRWVSRAEFNMFRRTDPYISYCWSKDMKGKSYIYSQREEEVYGKIYQAIMQPHDLDRWQSMREVAKAILELSIDIRKEDATKAIWDNANSRHKANTLQAIEQGTAHASLQAENADRYSILQQRSEAMFNLQTYFIDALNDSRLQKALVRRLSGKTTTEHYFRRTAGWTLPTEEQYAKLQLMLPKLTRTYADIRGEYEQAKAEYDYLWKGRTANEKLMERLGTIEPINTLDNLRSMWMPGRCKDLTISRLDYAKVIIPSDSVIYCDPPHVGEQTHFDFRRFYDWATHQQVPVFITEYQMPATMFHPVATLKTDADNRTEYLFIPNNQPYECTHQMELHF